MRGIHPGVFKIVADSGNEISQTRSAILTYEKDIDVILTVQNPESFCKKFPRLRDGIEILDLKKELKYPDMGSPVRRSDGEEYVGLRGLVRNYKPKKTADHVVLLLPPTTQMLLLRDVEDYRILYSSPRASASSTSSDFYEAQCFNLLKLLADLKRDAQDSKRTLIVPSNDDSFPPWFGKNLNRASD